MKKVVLCPNPYRDRQLATTKNVCRILDDLGIEAAITLPFHPDLSEMPKELTYQPLKAALKTHTASISIMLFFIKRVCAFERNFCVFLYMRVFICNFAMRVIQYKKYVRRLWNTFSATE